MLNIFIVTNQFTTILPQHELVFEFVEDEIASVLGEIDRVVINFLDEIGLGEMLDDILHRRLLLADRSGDAARIDFVERIAVFHRGFVELDEKLLIGRMSFLTHGCFLFSRAPAGVSSIK